MVRYDPDKDEQVGSAPEAGHRAAYSGEGQMRVSTVSESGQDTLSEAVCCMESTRLE